MPSGAAFARGASAVSGVSLASRSSAVSASPSGPGRRMQPKLSLSERRRLMSPLPSLAAGTDASLSTASAAAGTTSITTTRSPASSLRNAASGTGPLRLSAVIGSSGMHIDADPQSQLKSYSKYIDVTSGSLNFAGKASLDAHGINFSNGTSFNISLDELELLEELGRGNYGTVTKVLHRPSNVIMAMKEIRLELDEAKLRQIVMELDVLHKCDSPFIVDFFGAFFVDGAVYICMEYMDGGSLDKLYGSGVDEPVLARITECVVRGLKALKDDHNIIHRDVKPTNILASSAGTIKLCDFGVSGNLVASIARTNIGCQSYMAPERIRSTSKEDAITYTVQSDIWSLGLTLLEIAKGSYPYPPETYGNIFSQLSAIVDGEPPILPEPRFSHEAASFVKQCLNKNAVLRPSYAKLLAHPWLVKYRTRDIDVAAWVKSAQERRHSDKHTGSPRPALHSGGGL
ncbi:kinase-like domain-containing protein [Limtongia smithiae]|uniref:kinase-like domain-containing protein n=1 Tax=Limtongia smithiae TaxID=1125753 RepID=UPI0034CD4D84